MSGFIRGMGTIWFYDSMLTGTSLIYEGQNIDSITTHSGHGLLYTVLIAATWTTTYKS